MAFSLLDILALVSPWVAVVAGIIFMVAYASRDRTMVLNRLDRGEVSRKKLHEDIDTMNEKVDGLGINVAKIDTYLRNKPDPMR